MSILNRPYAGTWAPNRRIVVQYTPDALVYLNGDTSLPGCRTCHHNIDLQQFITSVSVDMGVEPGASSSSISLSIPKTYGDSVFRDGNSLLRTGLEVHVYFRGYFPMKGMTPTTTGEVDLGEVPQYPYYPVFHGVVTSVSQEYSGGYYSASLTCAGMLHFWQHIKFSSSGSYFGARPANSAVRPTLTGHPLRGRSPHSIIYNLYRDVAGSAAGVGFALSSRTNYGAISSVTRDSLYALTIRYWERRFRDRMYGLRMHGASGQMFTAAQQAYVSLYQTNSRGGHANVASLSPSTARSTADPLARDPAQLLNLRATSPDGRVLRQVDLNLLPSLNGGALGLSMEQMQAFATDIGSFGQVNLFESTYESKLDIATAVTQITGFEFYQDADGDLVFKPPLFNLDTSSSRVYRIEPEDIISISYSESEPEATYVVVKGTQFGNMQGVLSESEWGCRSVYVDYKAVAQYGWREASVESTYYNNAKSAFFVGVAHLDRINAGVNSCSVTIPLRPEIRAGFPVYIPDIDCYYYVQSVSHALSFGGQCTTTLNLVARRRKFIPPGVPSVRGSGDLPGVDLSRTDLNPLPLQALDSNGVPRLVGMPNVVMALDPQAINPMFSVMGFGAEEATLSRGSRARQNINRQTFLTNFIQVLWERGVLGAPGTSRNGNPNRPAGFWYRSDPNQEWGVAVGDHYTTFTVSYAHLRTALDQYIQFRDDTRTAIARLRRRLADAANSERRDPALISRLEQNIATLQANLEPGTGLGEQGDDAALGETASQLTEAASIIREAGVQTGVGAERRAGPRGAAPSNDPDRVALLAYLIRQLQVQRSGAVARDTDSDPTGTIDTTTNLLELLSERKAAMSVNVPGQYRYYSASHPDPNQQGYAPLTRDEEVGGETETPEPSDTPTVTGNPPFQRTRMTGAEAARYLRQAYTEITGHPPSNAVLAAFLGQWAIESGTGTRMYNFNFGGVKIPRSGWNGGRVLLPTHETVGGQRVATRAWFQAYGTAPEGARAYLRNIIRNYGEAIAAVESSGNAVDYGRYMARYHTGDNSQYAQDIARQAERHAPAWIREADSGPEEAPAAGTVPAQRVPVPEAELTTTVLRRATDVEGIPAERAAQYVTAGTHVPARGLEVRTFTSNRPRVVPSSHIRTLTFEARTYTRVTRGTTVVFRAGQTPATVVSFLQSCLAGNAALVSSLAREMEGRAGPALTNVAQTPAQLVRAAVPNTAGLRGPAGPLTTRNITGGRPNEVSDPAPATVGSRETARTIIQNKARALLSEVTAGNRAALQSAITQLQELPANTTEVPAAVARSLSVWRTSLAALYAHGLPSALPFRTETGAHEITGRTEAFSPVFPVSDERGYEHYGAFQYGRGLSIEPGGNYERLMAADPLRYADPAHVDALINSIIRHPGAGLSSPGATAALRQISSDTEFQSSPGAAAALSSLRWAENDRTPGGDRTAMIASGLRNYIMSDRDSVNHLPVNNAAFNLAELQPQGTEEVCACRGAEADLLLAAYMAGAGETTFVGVEAPADEATTWVKGQMAQAAASWSLAQEALRGSGGGRGQRTMFDSLSEIRGVGDSFSVAGESLSRELVDRIETGGARLDRAGAAVDQAAGRVTR